MKKKIDSRLLIALGIFIILSFFPIKIFIESMILKNNYNDYLNVLSEASSHSTDRGSFVKFNGDIYKVDGYNSENYYRLIFVAKQGKVVEVTELDENYLIEYFNGARMSFTKVKQEEYPDYLVNDGVLIVFKYPDEEKYYSYVTDKLRYYNLEYIILSSGGAKKIGN